MKKFKAKKINKKRKKYITYIFTFFLFFTYVFVFFYFEKNKSNYVIKKSILNYNTNYFKINIIDIINKKINYLVKTPTNFLNSNIKNVTSKNILKNKVDNIKKVSNIITNETKEIKTEYKPIVYIYNTHNLEEYNNYGVYDASYLLSDILNQNGIQTLFEEESVATFLQTNNLKYYEAYNVSRNYISSAKEKYSSLTYFFDIHRDTISKEKSTITYDGKDYAKVLFLIGLENNNYLNNLDNTTKLNNIIESKVPGISRGIMKKEGKNVNGIYNQDLSSNVFLIEVGAVDNTKSEVENTINIISSTISDYINGAL